MSEIKEIIGKNLTALRNASGITQADLGKSLNYSDKSVSKWELGESLPPIDVLKTLADKYGVTLDYLTNEFHDNNPTDNYSSKANKTNKIVITLLSVSLVWLIATISYISLSLSTVIRSWLVFIASIPVSSIVLLVFNGIWGRRVYIFIITSILVWSLLLFFYLLLLEYNIWLLFAIGIPLQIAIVLWAQLKPTKKL